MKGVRNASRCDIIIRGGEVVGYISYGKLIARLRERNVTSYTIRKVGDIGQATMTAIMTGRSSKANGRKRGTAINTETLAALCKRLECQPGDLLEYVEEPTESGEVSETDEPSDGSGNDTYG
jgi:putative transcriptional regulator